MGVLRHGGFIPWDHDADIVVLVKSLAEERRLDALLSELGHRAGALDKVRWYIERGHVTKHRPCWLAIVYWYGLGGNFVPWLFLTPLQTPHQVPVGNIYPAVDSAEDFWEGKDVPRALDHRNAPGDWIVYYTYVNGILQ